MGTESGAWVRFVVTGVGFWVRLEGAGIGTREESVFEVRGPAEPVIRSKVLPTFGDSTEVGLFRLLAVSKVLVK